MPSMTDALAPQILRATTTPGAKLVLLHLLSNAQQDGRVEVHIPDVAEGTSMTSRGVYKALDFLERDGLVTHLSSSKARAAKREWQINVDALARQGVGGDS